MIQKSLLITIFIYISLCNLAQQSNLTKEMYDFVSGKMEEKLFLHIDKETCQPGDTIWFRGFLTTAIQNKPIDYSRYIYVEIFDRQDSVYIREKIERSGEDSLFVGCIAIPENLQQGEYFIRSYTYYMQNVDESYYDTKRIRIINPFDHRVVINTTLINKRGGERELQLSFGNRLGTIYENLEFQYRIPGETPWGEFMVGNTGYSGKANIIIKDSLSDHILIKSTTNSIVDIEQYIAIPNSKRDFHAQFMPEGGSLIANAKQKIGVKAIGRDGLGIQVYGKITDKFGTTIADFSTNNLGMGSFEIDNNPTEQYIAIIKSKEGREKRYKLPTPTENSYAIKLENSNNGVNYSILHSNNISLRNKELLVISRGILLLQIDLNKSPQATLTLNDCPEGILLFRLVDKGMKIYSERLYYNYKTDRPRLSLITPYELTGEHESEIITLKFDNEEDIVDGDFAISITNNRLNQNGIDNCGIESYMLLNSDLQGYIENPDYYFSNSDRVRFEELDNLMLTQGWRRYDLPISNKYYLERGQFISGRVENIIGKKSSNATIKVEGSNGITKQVICNENGEFLIEDIYFREGTQFTLKAYSKRGGSNQKIIIDNQTFSHLNNTVKESAFIRNCDSDFYQQHSKDYIYSDNGILINTLGYVNVRENPTTAQYKLIKDSIEKRNRELFHLGITDISTYGSFGRFQTPWGENIGFYNSNNQYSGYSMYVPGSMGDTYSYYQRIVEQYSPSSYKENNMKATRAHYSFKTYNVEMPQLLGVKYNFMSFSSAGVTGIGIYDYYLPHIKIEFNTQTFTPLAPQLSEYTTFYQPHYNVDKEIMNIVDEKITRYWNPCIKLSSGSQLNITFPRAKLDDTYTITVNGITNSGTPLHLEYSFE